MIMTLCAVFVALSGSSSVVVSRSKAVPYSPTVSRSPSRISCSHSLIFLLMIMTLSSARSAGVIADRLRFASCSRMEIRIATARQLIGTREHVSHHRTLLLLVTGLRVGSAVTARIGDLGHDRGHRVLDVVAKRGRR